MSAALSLLDEDPFEPTDVAEPMDPHVVRDRPSLVRALMPGGISVPMLIVATVVASPALVQCLHRSITFTTLLERWVVIALGCWAISEGARRYIALTQRKAATSEESEPSSDDAIGESDQLNLE